MVDDTCLFHLYLALSCMVTSRLVDALEVVILNLVVLSNITILYNDFCQSFLCTDLNYTYYAYCLLLKVFFAQIYVFVSINALRADV